ncbi:MAG: LytTR family DNA-binding domain-containing protein [Bacteroidota bacterium]
MKRILIVEDEKMAAEKLSWLLQDLLPRPALMTVQTAREAIALLQQDQQFDLGFFDVQLADDSSFEIFKNIEIKFPIIFLTAYDDYVMKALEEHAIDYLLKPIRRERLMKAVSKIQKLRKHFEDPHPYDGLGHASDIITRQRFLVKKGVEYKSVPLSDIAYFFTEHKVVFLVDQTGEKYIVDQSITELDIMLPNDQFFRLNRKYIARIDAIDRFRTAGGKLLISLLPAPSEDVYVSKDNAGSFREWITQ